MVIFINFYSLKLTLSTFSLGQRLFETQPNSSVPSQHKLCVTKDNVEKKQLV